MTRGRHRQRFGNSLGSIVNDLAHIASRFGPMGALTTGAIGFAIFYAAIPLGLVAWVDANKLQSVGPATAVFASLLDQVIWQRVIGPCQWAGIATLLVCWSIAAWKVYSTDPLTNEELAGASWVAKMLAKLLR